MQVNQHKISVSTAATWIAVVIGVVVLFQVMAALFPTLTESGQTLNDSGFPLGELFVSGGAIWYILAAAVIYLLITSFGSGKGK